MLADRVVPEPEYLKVRQVLQVLELTQVADKVLSQVELLQLGRALEDAKL